MDVAGLYSPPRVTVEAAKFGLKTGKAWDPTTGWHVSKHDHREQAEAYLHEEEPLVIIGSPPCTPFRKM